VSILARYQSTKIKPSPKSQSTNPLISEIDPTLLTQFDLLFSPDDSVDLSPTDIHEYIHNHLGYLSTFDEEQHNNLVEIVYRASQIKTQFSSKAHVLLRSYFLALRRTNRQISLGTFETLVKIASNHAKLGFCSRITIVNVLVAIELMEEIILLRNGESLLGFKYKLLNNKRNLELYGTDTFSQYTAFYKHLSQTCNICTIKMEE